ncbi:MAG: hypothetical protein FJ045_06285, partial [Crenarchaeota archaeon]|nr:hypothetical protein [Thermoproteota archaeon]
MENGKRPSEAIFIEDKDERFAFKVGESTIWYRRLGAEGLRLIREVTTSPAGKMDSEAFQRLVFERCILGWENVYSGKPPYKELSFSVETAMKMPESVRTALIAELNAIEFLALESIKPLPKDIKKVISEAAELKNSSSTARPKKISRAAFAKPAKSAV